MTQMVTGRKKALQLAQAQAPARFLQGQPAWRVQQQRWYGS